MKHHGRSCPGARRRRARAGLGALPLVAAVCALSAAPGSAAPAHAANTGLRVATFQVDVTASVDTTWTEPNHPTGGTCFDHYSVDGSGSQHLGWAAPSTKAVAFQANNGVVSFSYGPHADAIGGGDPGVRTTATGTRQGQITEHDAAGRCGGPQYGDRQVGAPYDCGAKTAQAMVLLGYLHSASKVEIEPPIGAFGNSWSTCPVRPRGLDPTPAANDLAPDRVFDSRRGTLELGGTQTFTETGESGDPYTATTTVSWTAVLHRVGAPGQHHRPGRRHRSHGPSGKSHRPGAGGCPVQRKGAPHRKGCVHRGKTRH